MLMLLTASLIAFKVTNTFLYQSHKELWDPYLAVHLPRRVNDATDMGSPGKEVS